MRCSNSSFRWDPKNLLIPEFYLSKVLACKYYDLNSKLCWKRKKISGESAIGGRKHLKWNRMKLLRAKRIIPIRSSTVEMIKCNCRNLNIIFPSAKTTLKAYLCGSLCSIAWKSNKTMWYMMKASLFPSSWFAVAFDASCGPSWVQRWRQGSRHFKANAEKASCYCTNALCASNSTCIFSVWRPMFRGCLGKISALELKAIQWI